MAVPKRVYRVLVWALLITILNSRVTQFFKIDMLPTELKKITSTKTIWLCKSTWVNFTIFPTEVRKTSKGILDWLRPVKSYKGKLSRFKGSNNKCKLLLATRRNTIKRGFIMIQLSGCIQKLETSWIPNRIFIDFHCLRFDAGWLQNWNW